MFNLDLEFEELLEDIFSVSQDQNEDIVKLFCDDVLKK
jgi:hypothetical protein